MLEPAYALGGAAVGKGVRSDVAPGLLLQAIVANGAGCVQDFFNIALFKDVLGLVSAVGPDLGGWELCDSLKV